MNIFLQLAPMLLVFVVFYFILILPEKKRKKQYGEMLDTLQLNDEVMTRGGVVGKIVSLDGDYMVLESGPDRTRIRFSKNAIASKVYKED
ncbi:preprotein translocase subunit YajC [Clostridium paraputrificum]|uniref:preprotein translocase subunit YajC n=1 Tax=Clostridium paraputrificum TaxID=29363 RepID=UPI003D32FA77